MPSLTPVFAQNSPATRLTRAGRFTLLLLVTGAAVLFVILFGLAVGMGYGVELSALAMGSVGVFIWMLLVWRSYAIGSTGLFWWMFVLTFLIAFISTFSPVSINPAMQAWFLLVAILAFPMVPWWWRNSKFAKAFYVLFAVFLFFAVASSILGHSRWMSLAYQFLYDFKFPLMLLLGMRIAWSPQTDARFWRMLCWLWVPILIFVLLQLAVPHAYYTLAKGAAEGVRSITGNPFLRGHLPRVMGPFVHSGLLAFFSALFLALLVARILAGQRDTSDRKPGFAIKWAAFMYFLLLILSGQRQETMACLITLALMWIVAKTRFSPLTIMTVPCIVALAGAGVLFALGDEQIATLKEEWTITRSTSAMTSTRAIFYADAFGLANRHFPMGVGLGRFAGVGAQKFDHRLYDQLGYQRYWWYRENLFLVDTYWPNYIAEAGWLGTAALFLAVLTLNGYVFIRAWRETNPHRKMLWSMALAGQLLPFIISASSPLLSDPTSVGLAMLFFGIALVEHVKNVRSDKV